MDRSKTVPLKDHAKGEAYSADEIAFLKQRWSEEDVATVTAWILAGPGQGPPDCVDVITLPENPKFPQHDLRGIDLSNRLSDDRPADAPAIVLGAKRLEYANLYAARLAEADLRWIHLEHASLVSADLAGANVTEANLEGALLHCVLFSGADLRWSRFDGADFQSAELDGANLFAAHLEGAKLIGAMLIGADLKTAHLDGADLSAADLTRANLLGAHLERADFSVATIAETEFSGVFLDETVFRDVLWRPAPKALPDPEWFTDFDVRGIRYSDPLFDQFVRQSQFVRRCEETWPRWAFHLWRLTCDCGRSIARWLVVCAVVIVVFAFVFALAAGLDRPVITRPQAPDRDASGFTYLYFSAVTFSALGFGDVTPASTAGQLLVVIEVLSGYVMLGGLISIFTMKFVPPR